MAIGNQRLADIAAFGEFDYRIGERLDVTGGEETDDLVIEVERVDLSLGGDHGNSLGHEFHYFSAVRFVAEAIGPLGDDADVCVRHDLGNIVEGGYATEFDRPIEPQPVCESTELMLHLTGAVEVELGIR